MRPSHSVLLFRKSLTLEGLLGVFVKDAARGFHRLRGWLHEVELLDIIRTVHSVNSTGFDELLRIESRRKYRLLGDIESVRACLVGDCNLLILLLFEVLDRLNEAHVVVVSG